MNPQHDKLLHIFTDALAKSSPEQRERYLAEVCGRDGGQTWSTVDAFRYTFGAKAAAIAAEGDTLFVAGCGSNNDDQPGEHWLVRRGTRQASGAIQWELIDDFRPNEDDGLLCRPHGLALDHRKNIYVVGEAFFRTRSGPTAHWTVRRGSAYGRNWAVVDKYQLYAGSRAEACAVVAGTAGVYVAGKALCNTQPHWIVRHSRDGEGGSWCASDHVPPPTPPPPVQSPGDFARELFDGPGMLPPMAWSCGLTVAMDARRVFVGGLTTLGLSGCGVVRHLDIGGPAQVARNYDAEPE